MTQNRIILLGDSLIEFYDWQQRFPGRQMINRGRSGETVAELLARLPGEINAMGRPRLVLIMIGTNNLAMEDYSFLPAYTQIVEELIQAVPAARLCLNSLLPLRLPWLAESAVLRLNRSLKGLAASRGCGFLDVARAFAEADPSGSSCFLEDGVHLTGRGYGIWTSVLEDYLDKMLE